MKTRKQAEKEKRRNELSKSAMFYTAFFGGATLMAAVGNAFYGLPNAVTVALEVLTAIPVLVLVVANPEIMD